MGTTSDIVPTAEFLSRIRDSAISHGLLVSAASEYSVCDTALLASLKKREAFENMRSRFKNSIALRIKREFLDLTDSQASLISSDIESCLITYFKEGGLTLASLLFSRGSARIVPNSVIPFMVSETLRYKDFTMRQAFFKASVDVFLRSESVEREYLGRISQGFFAFHSLGVFGDAALERLNLVKDYIWILDSDTQIHALALGSSANMTYRESLSRLKSAGVRLFTITSLLDETRAHLWFAATVIRDNGPTSPYVFAAARGETPFRKSNVFLEGFIRWCDAGNPCNWNAYLYEIFKCIDYSGIDFKTTLGSLGIEVVELSEWPGFQELHYHDVTEYAERIAARWEQSVRKSVGTDSDLPTDPLKKAKPEAEAYAIIRRERSGEYHIISELEQKSPAWFISHTSLLNILETAESTPITWQPEAFLSYASTLCDIAEPGLAEEAFERILVGLAQSGLNLLDDATIGRVFGGVIDQGRLKIEELFEEHTSMLQKKYGESPASVLARISVPYFPIAALQASSELAQMEATGRRLAEIEARKAENRATKSEKELKELQHFKNKLLRKKSKRRKGR